MSRTLLALGLLVVVVAVAALTPDLRGLASAAVSGDEEAVRSRLDDLGAFAALALAVGGLLHVLVPFPAELLTAAAGYAFGVAVGIPLMLAIWLLSALVAYELSRGAGRPLARRLAGEERLGKLERMVERGGWRAMLLLRAVPLVPFNAVCAAAGIGRVPLWRFAWTTVVGILPLTAITTVFGARLQSPSLTDPLLWGTILGFIALVGLTPLLTRRRAEV